MHKINKYEAGPPYNFVAWLSSCSYKFQTCSKMLLLLMKSQARTGLTRTQSPAICGVPN